MIAKLVLSPQTKLVERIEAIEKIEAQRQKDEERRQVASQIDAQIADSLTKLIDQRLKED